ncbi:MAG: ABC transporter substrate-binding protein [Anaerolineae bacterium]
MPPLPSTLPPDRTVYVAVLTPMTGELATFGETVRNGISLAFDEWNQQAGPDGPFIQWVLEDTRCDPLQARQAAIRAIEELGVQFIVGGLCSESAIPIARVANEQGALFVSATATHPLVTVDDTGDTRRLAFRASYVYPYQARAAAHFALEELDARRAAILTNVDDAFARSLAEEFGAAFVAGGGQIVATSVYTSGRAAVASSQADFEAVVAELISAAPQVLYVPDGYPVANKVGSIVKSPEFDVTLIGSEIWDNGALDLEALEGAYFTTHYSREIPDPLAGAWRERYLSAFAVEPDTLAALGYDAASLLISAISQADNPTAVSVAHSLEAVEFEGVTGRWRFDARHDPQKPVVVNQIRGGDVVFHNRVRP